LRTFAGALLTGAVAAIAVTSAGSSDTSHDGSLWVGDVFGLQRTWNLHEGRHWQIVSSVSEEPAITDLVEGNRGDCPRGTVEVRGRMKVDQPRGSVDAMQKQLCSDWISTDFPERCAQFDEAKWKRYIAEVPSVERAFCIDRYEYPNAKGQFPWVFVSWNEAADLCESQGKRLCSEEEWTFACEGEEAAPYPYGFTRSSDACVIDHAFREYDERIFGDRSSPGALRELDRVWQGEASGSRPLCRSPFGVYDMTGNVDEWTYSTERQGVRSILKGGYWAEVRARCRPSTRVHGENFAFYQQGFRCCADVSP
jgi:hypothetical protein